MYKNYFLIFALLAVSTLTGCAAISTETSGDYALAKHPDKGLAIVGVEPYRLEVNKGYQTHVWIRNAKTKEHITSTRGKITALNLSPGEYEFFKITVIANYVDQTALISVPKKRYHNQDIKPRKFIVKAGKAIYAGNFNFIPNYDVIKILSSGKDAPSDINFKLKFTDQRKKDLATFRSQYKNIKQSELGVWIAR